MRQTVPGEISKYGEGFVKGLAIDAVIFGFHNNQLKILIIEHGDANLFALPGGYIYEKEDLNDAAKRILASKTGLDGIFLDQFHIFGNYDRNNPETIKVIMQGQGIPPDPDHWILGRFFSVGFYALVDFTKAIPRTDALSDSCTWYDINDLPPLILDHKQIADKALEVLRENLDKKIGFNLLPETFTMATLKNLYETILGVPLLRSNFQRKILSLDILERAEDPVKYAHKAPFLYKFRRT
ncbi:NUDIX hydrolase [Dyadobacter diqingensis]|uniref:NUDIX hydrolase n=1 Tax=Dyadobacter diqingensis TaxID=2938121 RepID=UPI0020C1B5FC|nr:NUDIX domain-containing protein [Dyadobacter diqingensis]